MELSISELRKKDYRKAIRFALQGMHFNRYLHSKILLNLYGKYYWYSIIVNATSITAAYTEKKLAGVLVTRFNGETELSCSLLIRLYLKMCNFIINRFCPYDIDVYSRANKNMFRQYIKSVMPDGEIMFLAANPDMESHGVGTLLINELKRAKSGKTVYLFTDDGCTYQFYEHRGFSRAHEESIIMDFGGNKVPVKCLLYSRVL